MKYFLHDSNSFNDEKITELYLEFGYEGLGLFYTILEKLALQEKPIKTIVLKHQLNVGKKLEKCWKFMEDIDLISSNNGETFNKQLLNFSEKYKVTKEKNAKRIAEWRENQSIKENVTSNKIVSNASKVKESKVNESKEKESNNIAERKTHFFELVNSYSDLLGNEFDNFFNYWAEPSKSGKMRFEAEKFFDVQRRINTWMQRANPKKNNTFEMSKTESVFRTINQAKEELLNDLANGNSTIFEKF